MTAAPNSGAPTQAKGEGPCSFCGGLNLACPREKKPAPGLPRKRVGHWGGWTYIIPAKKFDAWAFAPKVLEEQDRQLRERCAAQEAVCSPAYALAAELLGRDTGPDKLFAEADRLANAATAAGIVFNNTIANEGYQSAFYEIARMVGIPAQPRSPQQVWEGEMRPRLLALLATNATVKGESA